MTGDIWLTRVRWDQRAMAALGVVYVVVQYVSTVGRLDEAYLGTTAIIYGAVAAAPQLAWGRGTFAVVCAVLAGLILVAGALLAEVGLFVYWPVCVPLLLATIRIPERWTTFVTPIVVTVVMALLAAAAYAFTNP